MSCRRPEQQHVLAVGDPARGGEVGIDRGLRFEVEARELLQRREVGKLQRQLDAPVVFPDSRSQSIVSVSGAE
jgi:hypothetical protein